MTIYIINEVLLQPQVMSAPQHRTTWWQQVWGPVEEGHKPVDDTK
jgi:hypothetical protein